MNLYEDGFSTKVDRIKVLARKGMQGKQIAEKVGVSEEKVNEVLNSPDSNGENLNE